jgi:hypothetical protein
MPPAQFNARAGAATAAYGPEQCIALLEDAQCGDAADASAALRRIALHAPAPHPAVTDAVLQLAVVHPAATIPHIPDIVSAGPRDVGAAIAVFGDLLQADRDLLVPVIGALADLPLSVTHRTQARATLTFALDTVDDNDVPTVVRAIFRAASTPALARWAAPTLRAGLARPLNSDVVLVVGLILIEACRSRPLISRALLSRDIGSGPKNVPHLTWLDIVSWATALEYRVGAQSTRGKHSSITAGSSAAFRSGYVASKWASPSPRCLVGASIYAFLRRSAGLTAFPVHALNAVRVAAPTLAKLAHGSRRLVASLVENFPHRTDPRPLVKLVCMLVELLPSLAAPVVQDLSRAASLYRSTPEAPIVPGMTAALPELILASLVRVVRTTIMQPGAGVRLPPDVAVRVVLQATENEVGNSTSADDAAASLHVTGDSVAKTSKRPRVGPPQVVASAVRFSAVSDINDAAWAELFIRIRKGLLFGGHDDQRYALCMAQSVVAHATPSVAAEMVSLLDTEMSTDLSDSMSIPVLCIIGIAALRRDRALGRKNSEDIYARRVHGAVPGGLFKMVAIVDSSNNPASQCLNVDISYACGQSVSSLNDVVCAAISLLGRIAFEDRPAIAKDVSSPSNTENMVHAWAEMTLSSHVLIPESCVPLYQEAGSNIHVNRTEHAPACGLETRENEAIEAEMVDDAGNEKRHCEHNSNLDAAVLDIRTIELVTAVQSFAFGVGTLVGILNMACHMSSLDKILPPWGNPCPPISAATTPPSDTASRDSSRRHLLLLVLERVTEMTRMYRACQRGRRVLEKLSNQKNTSGRGGSDSGNVQQRRLENAIHEAASLYVPAIGSIVHQFGESAGEGKDGDNDPTATDAVQIDLRATKVSPELSASAIVTALLSIPGDRKFWDSDSPAPSSHSKAANRDSEIVQIESMLLNRLLILVAPSYTRAKRKGSCNTAAVNESSNAPLRKCPRDVGTSSGSASFHPAEANEIAGSGSNDVAANSLEFLWTQADQFYDAVQDANISNEKSHGDRTSMSGAHDGRSSMRPNDCSTMSCSTLSAAPAIGRLTTATTHYTASRSEKLKTSAVSKLSNLPWSGTCGLPSQSILSVGGGGHIDVYEFVHSPLVLALLLSRAAMNNAVCSKARRDCSNTNDHERMARMRDSIAVSGLALRCASILLRDIMSNPAFGSRQIDATPGLGGDGNAPIPAQWTLLLHQTENQLHWPYASSSITTGCKIVDLLRWISQDAVDSTLSSLALDLILCFAEMGCVSVGEAREHVLADLQRVHEYDGDVLWAPHNRAALLCDPIPNWILRGRASGLIAAPRMGHANCSSIDICFGRRSSWWAERYRLVALFGGMDGEDALDEARVWTRIFSAPMRPRSLLDRGKKQSDFSAWTGMDGDKDIALRWIEIFGVEPILELLLDTSVSLLTSLDISPEMSTRRASGRKKSPVFGLCSRLLLHLIKLYHSASASLPVAWNKTAADFERRAFTKLCQGASLSRSLVGNLVTWYANPDVDVSSLSIDCVMAIQRIAVVSSGIATTALALAENVKSEVQNASTPKVKSRGKKRPGWRSDARTTGEECDLNQLRAAMSARRAIPRLVMNAEGLKSVAQELARDIGLKRRAFDALAAVLTTEKVHGVMGSGVRRWRKRQHVAEAVAESELSADVEYSENCDASGTNGNDGAEEDYDNTDETSDHWDDGADEYNVYAELDRRGKQRRADGKQFWASAPKYAGSETDVPAVEENSFDAAETVVVSFRPR